MFLYEQKELREKSLLRFNQLIKELEDSEKSKADFIAEVDVIIENLKQEKEEIGSIDKIKQDLIDIQELLYVSGREQRPVIQSENEAE